MTRTFLIFIIVIIFICSGCGKEKITDDETEEETDGVVFEVDTKISVSENTPFSLPIFTLKEKDINPEQRLKRFAEYAGIDTTIHKIITENDGSATIKDINDTIIQCTGGELKVSLKGTPLYGEMDEDEALDRLKNNKYLSAMHRLLPIIDPEAVIYRTVYNKKVKAIHTVITEKSDNLSDRIIKAELESISMSYSHKTDTLIYLLKDKSQGTTENRIPLSYQEALKISGIKTDKNFKGATIQYNGENLKIPSYIFYYQDGIEVKEVSVPLYK